jgi:hypothetical protein
LNLPKRNLYITYKAFPSGEKLATAVKWQESQPVFQHGAQFPVLMNPDTIEKMERFAFVLEIWDQINPGKDELVGLVKIPLSSFCYSLQTTQENVFSLNFLAD